MRLADQVAPCANPGHCQELPQLSVENGVMGTFEGRPVSPPVIDLAEVRSSSHILGETAATGEKHIYVDLKTQTLSAYQ